jgi:hypothetical protein
MRRTVRTDDSCCAWYLQKQIRRLIQTRSSTFSTNYMTLLYATISLIISIGCYSISQLAQHKKLLWTKDYFGFWGENQDKRKYKKNWDADPLAWVTYPAPDNWYYKYIARVKYKERWFTSSNLTSFATDGYHLCQSLSFAFLALAFALVTDISYFIFYWPGIILVHASVYRLLSKKI